MLERRIERRELQEVVELAGSMDEESVRVRLESSHLFALASHDEALGVATMEAMAMQRPVVATDVGGVHELVIDGETGRLVPVHNPHHIAGAIKEIANDPEMAKRMGERGRHRIRAGFSSDQSAKAIASRLGLRREVEERERLNTQESV
jgi:glycosyltransferase involved in cell wall biosynthesis